MKCQIIRTKSRGFYHAVHVISTNGYVLAIGWHNEAVIKTRLPTSTKDLYQNHYNISA